jgi:hypothetical protein
MNANPRPRNPSLVTGLDTILLNVLWHPIRVYLVLHLVAVLFSPNNNVTVASGDKQSLPHRLQVGIVIFSSFAFLLWIYSSDQT